MTLGRWFQNEMYERLEQLNQRVEGLGKNEELLERVSKLEGEIKAMKMRMGKKGGAE